MDCATVSGPDNDSVANQRECLKTLLTLWGPPNTHNPKPPSARYAAAGLLLLCFCTRFFVGPQPPVAKASLRVAFKGEMLITLYTFLLDVTINLNAIYTCEARMTPIF